MHFAPYKSILSPQNGINLYRGCTHGCIYCDSRSKCYRMTHEFEDVEVKQDAVQILERQLQRKRKPCMIATGAMCDPYIPLEEKLCLTRQCFQLIRKYGFGLTVLTKSALILRDMDILQQINRRTKCIVQLTLTAYNEDLCRIVEPNVSTTAERFRVLKKMQEAGIPTVVWMSPVLPFINDTEENLRGLLNYCFDAGVRAILCFGFGMTLREGNREYFYKMLDRHFPGLKNRYIAQFGDAYVCNSPNNSRLMKILHEESRKHNVMCAADDVFEYLKRFETKEYTLF